MQSKTGTGENSSTTVKFYPGSTETYNSSSVPREPGEGHYPNPRDMSQKVLQMLHTLQEGLKPLSEAMAKYDESVRTAVMKGKYKQRQPHLPEGLPRLAIVTACEADDAADVKEILSAANRLASRGFKGQALQMCDFVRQTYGPFKGIPGPNMVNLIAVRVTRRWDLLGREDRRGRRGTEVVPARP